MPMQLVNLAHYRSREVADALRALLADAESGDLRGLVFVAKYGPSNNLAGIVGDYRRSPGEALQATFMLEREVGQSMQA